MSSNLSERRTLAFIAADGGAAKAKYAAGDDDGAVITENRGLLNFGKGRERREKIIKDLELRIHFQRVNRPNL